jgi:hypothetical protein
METLAVDNLADELEAPTCEWCGRLRTFLVYYGGQPIYAPCDCYERDDEPAFHDST